MRETDLETRESALNKRENDLKAQLAAEAKQEAEARARREAQAKRAAEDKAKQEARLKKEAQQRAAVSALIRAGDLSAKNRNYAEALQKYGQAYRILPSEEIAVRRANARRALEETRR